jgi:hypothetical protein
MAGVVVKSCINTPVSALRDHERPVITRKIRAITGRSEIVILDVLDRVQSIAVREIRHLSTDRRFFDEVA